jgi:DNA-binding SARP family transcriptional activator/tetratricopeptide (TPR) repeat protein
MPRLTICLLGPFTALLDGVPLTGFRSDKVRALLAYLAVEAHRPWTRATLADLLWPDFPEKAAQSNLRNAISNLRSVIRDQRAGTPFLKVDQETIQFNLASDYRLDVKEFMDLVSASTHTDAVRMGQQDALHLLQALQLYQGNLLEGFSVSSAPFEEWVLLNGEHIRQKALEAVRLLVGWYERTGDLSQALHHARFWLQLERWDEAAHRAIIRILAQQGHRVAALAQYETCRQQLKSNLGIEPEPATVRLYEQVRDGQVAPNPGDPDLFTSSQPLRLPGFIKEASVKTEEPPFFVARQKELQCLDAGFETVLEGEGRVLFVTGDAGSGKTALLTEFTRRAMTRYPDLIVLGSQCNAYTGQSDPYFPFRELAKMLSGNVESRVLTGNVSEEHALRLWRLIPQVVEIVLEDGPDLLDTFISSRDLLAAAHVNQAVDREQFVRLQSRVEQLSQPVNRLMVQQEPLYSQFTGFLSSLSQQVSLVLILDDLQWIDTDSVNLLFHLCRRLPGLRILLLGAYRPEDVAVGQAGKPHPLEGVIHELQTRGGDILIDLMDNDGLDFVELLLDGEPNRLGPDFRRLLHRHTNGHPLFTIELLRGMQLQGDIHRDNQGNWVERECLNWDKLPVRVEAVIAERIRHLPEGCQDLIRTACVEGEHFIAEILAHIHGLDEKEVIRMLSRELAQRHRLVAGHSRKQVQGKTLSQYRFSHILFQKYLYQQMDDVEKAHLHEQIGTTLEAFYLQDLDKFPEITQQLARHFELGGIVEKAVQYYTLSGRYAVHLSASSEAASHFQRALRLAKTLPGSPKQDGQVLNLHLSLGPALTAAVGWGAPELEKNYREAEDLLEKMHDDARLVPALWLLAVYHLGRSEHQAVDRLVERLARLANEVRDPGLSSLADLQVSPLYQGKLVEARQLLEYAAQNRDLELQRSLAYRYGMSPAVVGLAYLGNCLWLQGETEEAARRSLEACELAEEIAVPINTCYALSRICWQNAFCNEYHETRKIAGKLLQITVQHGFRNFELAAHFFLHWVNICTGIQEEQELENMHQAMEGYQGLGTILNRTTFLILFAKACGKARQIERGLDALDESLMLGTKTGERWYEAEAYRTKGELLVQLAEGSPHQNALLEEAEDCCQSALRVARQQGAKTLEVRAETSLCCVQKRLYKNI